MRVGRAAGRCFVGEVFDTFGSPANSRAYGNGGGQPVPDGLALSAWEGGRRGGLAREVFDTFAWFPAWPSRPFARSPPLPPGLWRLRPGDGAPRIESFTARPGELRVGDPFELLPMKAADLSD
jgi:hypothetical protein